MVNGIHQITTKKDINMKHLKKFNEKINNDAVYAIADSFNKVKEELDLLNKRLSWYTGMKVKKKYIASKKTKKTISEELDEFGSEIQQMKINFDELLSKFNDFDNEFFGR
jgi:archaellum component FlaC